MGGIWAGVEPTGSQRFQDFGEDRWVKFIISETVPNSRMDTLWTTRSKMSSLSQIAAANFRQMAAFHRAVSLARTPCSGCSIQRHDASASPHVTAAKTAIRKTAPIPLSKEPFQRNQPIFPVTNGARL